MLRLLAVVLLAAACGPSKSPRDARVREKLPEWAAAVFPDDSVEWRLISSESKGALEVATVEPHPAKGDYTKAKMVISFAKDEAPEVVGAVVLDGKDWVPLFEDEAAPKDWKSAAGL